MRRVRTLYPRFPAGERAASPSERDTDYDHIGNRRTSDVDAVPTTYTINNPLNQYTTVSNPSASLTYDADGNLLSDGSFNYTWDGANRLRSIEPLGPWQFGDKRLTFWYDYLGRVAFTQHEEYTNEYGYNHWGETGWDWFIYDGWNVVQEIEAYWWTPKAQYSWGLDLSQTLQGAGGIGGLLAMHVPADQCAAIGGGASAMSFRMPGSLAGLATAADGTADGLAVDGSVDPTGGGSGAPVGILERLIARRDALRAAGLLGGTGGASESTQTQFGGGDMQAQIDGGEVQTLTTGGDCDFWYLYDANGNVGQLLRYDAGTSAVSLAAAYEYDPYGNTLGVWNGDAASWNRKRGHLWLWP